MRHFVYLFSLVYLKRGDFEQIMNTYREFNVTIKESRSSWVYLYRWLNNTILYYTIVVRFIALIKTNFPDCDCVRHNKNIPESCCSNFVQYFVSVSSYSTAMRVSIQYITPPWCALNGRLNSFLPATHYVLSKADDVEHLTETCYTY